MIIFVLLLFLLQCSLVTSLQELFCTIILNNETGKHSGLSCITVDQKVVFTLMSGTHGPCHAQIYLLLQIPLQVFALPEESEQLCFTRCPLQKLKTLYKGVLTIADIA